MGILVRDMVMGSCKTTNVINEINSRSDEDRQNSPMLVIVPLKSEVNRFISGCHRECFKQPKSVYSESLKRLCSKSEHVLDLFSNGYSVVTTHALFDMFTDEIEYEIQKNNYSVVIDEEVVTIKPLLMTPDERRLVFVDSGYAKVNNVTGDVDWTGPTHPKFELDKRMVEFRKLIMSHRVVTFGGNLGRMFVVQTPPSFFKIVDKYTILTYMFTSSDLYSFFRMYGIKYEIEYQEREIENIYKAKVRELITFVDPPRSIRGLSMKRKTNFSSTHWNSSTFTAKFFTTLRGTLGEALKRKGIDAKDMVYACKKSLSMQSENPVQGKHLTPRGYKGHTIITKKEDEVTKEYYSNWIPYNSKATNKYSKKTFIVYMHNVYRNLHVDRYIASKIGCGDLEKRTTKDNDDYSLSVMLQCIWRTAIRNDKPIQVMIFSDRMKSLLVDWLDGEEIS